MIQLSMSGKIKTGLVAVVALLVLTNFVYENYETAGSSNYILLPTQKVDVNANYQTVSLEIVDITIDIYKKFINDIRDVVGSGSPVEGISRLRNSSTVLISKRFILVVLYSYEEKNITLVIDVTNLYVVGCRTEDEFYYFNDSSVDTSGIFIELPHTGLPFNSSYQALESYAKRDRISIPLGIDALSRSIKDLRNNRKSDLARSFIVVIQMVSEAVRFSYIEDQLWAIYEIYFPTNATISRETNWGALSKKIQNSVGGVFQGPPVQLLYPNGTPQHVCLVDEARKEILVMLYVSNTTTSNDPCSTSYNSRQGWLLSNNPEAIVTPIIGFKNLCLQPNYRNTVWIEECVSNKVAQDWAIYPDGSIRPNGNKDNCLTWESYPTQGKNVVIGPCDGGAGQRWQFNIDGSISNLNTNFVLDANLNLRQIIVLPFSGTASQIWQAWLL